MEDLSIDLEELDGQVELQELQPILAELQVELQPIQVELQQLVLPVQAPPLTQAELQQLTRLERELLQPMHMATGRAMYKVTRMFEFNCQANSQSVTTSKLK